MGKQRSVQLTRAALMTAIRKRKPERGLIFHTDRGIQYRAYEIRKIHRRYGILPSMNRPGQCTDNAEVESFSDTLKGNLVRERDHQCGEELRRSIAGYLQHFYNRKRVHSSREYRAPAEYEAPCTSKGVCTFSGEHHGGADAPPPLSVEVGQV